MSDIITGTPAGLTYEHALVQEAWLTVWIITSAALTLINLHTVNVCSHIHTRCHHCHGLGWGGNPPDHDMFFG